MKFLLIVLALLATQLCFAQNDKLGTWNMVNLKVNLDKKWSLFTESQLRSQLFFHDFFYYELKGGIGYAIEKNFMLLLGTGRYATYSNGGNFKSPFVNQEFRIWQQLTMNQYRDRIKFEHRYRVEQRWLTNGGYRNRFRYRLNTVLPLNNKNLEPKTFYLTAYDEVFLTNIAPYFERNRIFGGFGYKFSNEFIIQPGYIYQFDYRVDNTKSGKGFFQLFLFIETGGFRKNNNKLPAAID